MNIDTRRIARPLVLLASAGLLAACVGSPQAPTSPAPSASATPSAPGTPSASATPSASTAPSSPVSAGLLVEVTTEGGFIAPAAHIGTLPMVWVSDDGRILTPAPMTMQFPGRLVPDVTVRDVGPAGAEAIRRAIADAGLDSADYTDTSPGMPDVGQWVITVHLDGRTVTSRFNGLGAGAPGPSVPGASSPTDPRKAAASALIDRLTSTDETWGAATPAKESRYVPTGYRIWASPGAPQADPALARQPVAWPLSTPLASFGQPASPDFGIAGLRVGTVTGADATTIAPVLDKATSITPFASGGSSWTLRVRPLLPGEAAG